MIEDILKIALIAYMIDVQIQNEHTPLSWYGKLIEKLPWYLRKPMGGCYMCFTGQVCLWYFLFTKPFNLKELLFFIFASVLMSMVYNKIYCFLR